MRPRKTVVPIRAALPIHGRAVPLVPAAVPPAGTGAYRAADVSGVRTVPVSAAGVVGGTATGGVVGAAAVAGTAGVVVSWGEVGGVGGVGGGEDLAGLVEGCICAELG